jgi:hypothetical protein
VVESYPEFVRSGPSLNNSHLPLQTTNLIYYLCLLAVFQPYNETPEIASLPTLPFLNAIFLSILILTRYQTLIKMYFTFSPAPSPTNSIYSIYSVSPTSSSESTTQASCAYPSWPRRSSLSGSDDEERATSFISDDDLFPEVFDDSESDCTPVASPCQSPQNVMRETQLLSRSTVRDLVAMQQKAQKKRRSSSSSSRKSRRCSKPMSPIQEAVE